MRIKIGIIMLLIAGLMLTAGLVSAQETDPVLGAVSGKVLDATNGDPIEGALVEVEDSDPVLSANTNSSGEYTIEGVPVGGQKIVASADEYKSEDVGVVVSDTEEASANFTLQPVKGKLEVVESDSDVQNVKVAGTRKGYVGIFTAVTGAGTGASTEAFIVTTKKGDIEIQVPDQNLGSITRKPGRPQGFPVDGDRVAVLVEFVDQGPGELVKIARQVIVKPTPKPPIIGAVVSITTDENGVRTLSIMRPDGSTKVVRLGSKGEPPEVGDLVTAFQGRGGDDDGDEEDGPPVIRGLVRAQEVRQRLEGFLEDLTRETRGVPADVAERRAQRVADLAEKLEAHAAKHARIIERASQNAKLPPQAVAGMLNGLERAENGRAQAKARATEARTKAADARANAGPPTILGRQGGPDRGSSSGQGGQDRGGSSGQGGQDRGGSSGQGGPDLGRQR
ncbi:MAG: carboxypeptidase regulatory-like domain-containing protein [Chloroflexi bacterium]|nr:carboxypeptidase regulatory-like domain-containing protein [Chloroflexota bacterium]